jgi:YidC/Oxa1 family membrane protein insertase
MIRFLLQRKGKGAVNKNTIIAFSLVLMTILLFREYDIKRMKKVQQGQETMQTGNKPQQPQSRQLSPVTETMKPLLQETIAVDTSKNTIVSDDTVWVENDKIICGFSEIGARIISLRMKDYGYDRIKPKLSDPKEQVDLIASSGLGGGNLVIDGEEYDGKKFSYNGQKKIVVRKNEKTSITFSCMEPGGQEIQKRFSFEGNSYKIGYEIFSPSLPGKSVTVGWKGGITESEVYSGQPGKTSQSTYLNEQRKVHIFDGKSIEHIQMKKPEKKDETGVYQWAAVTSKYFMVSIIPDTMRDADILIEGYDANAYDDIKVTNKKVQNINYSLSIKRTSDKQREGFWIFAGPSKLSILHSYHKSFEKVLFGGWEVFLWANVWFPYICEFTLWLLVYIFGLLKDYGLAIILLTILIRLVTYPLTQSSMRSMNRMKLLQPKINAIRERYKKNPKKMNEEIMKMYREEGVNPLNPGCLPMFLQMPILFALFVVLQKAIELRGATTWMVPWVKDLSQPEILISLKQMGLADVFPNGIPMYGYGIALMPIIMAILTFFQNKMTIKDPNQKAMIYFMPPFMLVLFNNFPAGLVFYWTFSNALGIVQQYILNKSMDKEMAAAPAIPMKKQQPKAKGRR